MSALLDSFRLDGKVCVITGGAGFLGVRHAEAIAEAGGTPVLWDIDEQRSREAAESIATAYSCRCVGFAVNITRPENVAKGLTDTIRALGRVDILINNAANNPKAEDSKATDWRRFEDMPLRCWNADVAVGLTGAFVCCQTIGAHMAGQNTGVILNISSDLGLIGPDQRIYEKAGLAEEMQQKKPVTYSVVKHGLIGLTRYVATYWAHRNVRCNAVCPGGVYNRQPDDFVARLTQLIPMGRMAQADELKAAVLYLVSDASSYVTGAVLSVDGGRTCW